MAPNYAHLAHLQHLSIPTKFAEVLAANGGGGIFLATFFYEKF
jgi:hypothetical protein